MYIIILLNSAVNINWKCLKYSINALLMHNFMIYNSKIVLHVFFFYLFFPLFTFWVEK